MSNSNERCPNVSVWILWFFLKRACLCAPEMLLGTAGCWEGMPIVTWPTPTGQDADAHTSPVNKGQLTQPQRSEPHLDSCPKVRDFHLRAQSCRVKVYTALIGWRFDCYLIHC